MKSYSQELREFEMELQSEASLCEILLLPALRRLRDVAFITPLCTSSDRPATFNRYEHSVGVAYLIARAAALLGIERQSPIWRGLVAAGLLHDIGHPPFSHVSEQFLVQMRKRYHFHFTKTSIRAAMSSIAHGREVLQEADRVLRAKGPHTQLLHGLLSCDNLDGIFRSCLFFRIQAEDPRTLDDAIYGKHCDRGAVAKVWGLTKRVYQEKLLGAEVLATEAVLSRALEIAAQDDAALVSRLHDLGDQELLSRLRRAGVKLVDDLEKRNFFTPLWRNAPDIYWEAQSQLPRLAKTAEGRDCLRKWIAEELGISADDVVVYCKMYKEVPPLRVSADVQLPGMDLGPYISRSVISGRSGSVKAPIKMRRRHMMIHVFISPASRTTKALMR